MKKSLCLFFALAFICSSLLFSTSALIASSFPIDDVLSTFEKEDQGYITDNGDGSYTFAGKAPGDANDAYLNTYLLWDGTNNYDIADFIWEFDYTPSSVDWIQDRFYFRDVGENEWDGYCLMIVGKLAAGEEQAELRLRKGEDWNNTASYDTASFNLIADTTYRVKIVTVGHESAVWFYDKTSEMPAQPTLHTTLPDVEDSDVYHDMYLESGSCQIVSWGGKFTLANMSLTGIDGLTDLPAGEEVSNLLSLYELENDGHLTVDGDTISLAGKNSDFTGDAYLNTYLLLQDEVSDFVWEFDYTPSAIDWMQDRFFFRDTGENEWDGYCLMIVGKLSANKSYAQLKLRKGDDLNNTADYDIASFDLVADTTYRVRIICVDHDCAVWFYPADQTTPPEIPTLFTVLPDVAETDVYGEMFLSSGDFQVVTWGGQFDMSNQSLTVLDAEPTSEPTSEVTTEPTEAQETSTPDSEGSPQTADNGRNLWIIIAGGAATAALALSINKRKRFN